jgi:hypothetical protein
MPRSGTKLLRDILNNHSQIAITPIESHFLPEMYSRLTEFGDLRNRNSFARFYREFADSIFFRRLQEEGPFIDEESWYREVTDWTYPGVVETFYKAYARKKNKVIWGDKTPYYLVILPLIHQLYPGVRVIHIIRDARDYALSLKKGWYKNVFRATQRWTDAVRKCRTDGFRLPQGQYLEVRYEELVDEPEETLRRVCTYLSVPFEPSMVTLKKPTDKGGDAKNRTDIVTRNYGKWAKAFTPAQIRKMESVCAPILRDLGYPVAYEGELKRYGRLEMQWYKVLDGFGLLRHETEQHGLMDGIRNTLRTRKYEQFRRAGEEEGG